MSVRPALFLAACLAGCAPVNLLNATISTSGIAITRDVAYGADPRQVMDIYQPALPQPGHPGVVFFYGGSWNSGSKKDYKFVAATLAQKGVLVFVPDYRLYPQVRYPVFLQDCAAATAWAQVHAAQYGGDGRNIFLMGHSAGAYNVAMLALNPAYLGAAGTDPSTLRGAITLAGPFDFLPITGPEVKAVFGSAKEDPATQPITYARAAAPPMLLLAGSDDRTVLPRNTIRLAAAIRAKGGQVEDRIYPGVAHIGIVISIAPLFQGKDRALADTLFFIAGHKLPSAAR